MIIIAVLYVNIFLNIKVYDFLMKYFILRKVPT